MWCCSCEAAPTMPSHILNPVPSGTSIGSIMRLNEAGGQIQWLRHGRSPEALAVVTGHSWLFLRETQQLLPDGLDQGGRRVSRRRGLERRRQGHVAHTWGVYVHRGSRWLLDKTPGCLEDRGAWVVKTIQELKAGGTEGSRKRRNNKD